MPTIQKLSEKLTIHINRTGFYALISVFIAPFLAYPLFKLDNFKQKESKFHCTQLNSLQVGCTVEKNWFKENKTNLKQAKWGEVIKQAINDKPEIDKPSDFNYQIELISKNGKSEFSEIKRVQAGIEVIGRNIFSSLTDSKKSIYQTTNLDDSLEEANYSTIKIVIFYSFFIFIICSILESKPFYEKLIFDRKSQDLTVLKVMIFWFKKSKYSLGDDFNLSIESETDDYDTTTHKLNLILESKERIILYQNYNYNEVEKLLKEIREFLNLNYVKVDKIEV